jgi:hypothetical protein
MQMDIILISIAPKSQKIHRDVLLHEEINANAYMLYRKNLRSIIFYDY